MNLASITHEIIVPFAKWSYSQGYKCHIQQNSLYMSYIGGGAHTQRPSPGVLSGAVQMQMYRVFQYDLKATVSERGVPGYAFHYGTRLKAVLTH